MEEDRRLDGPAGKPGRAAGQVIYVMGRVLNVQGQPCRGRVELGKPTLTTLSPSESTNRAGRSKLRGFAIQDTDAEGRYRFKTIKPGAYPATANGCVRLTFTSK